MQTSKARKKTVVLQSGGTDKFQKWNRNRRKKKHDKHSQIKHPRGLVHHQKDLQLVTDRNKTDIHSEVSN